MCTVAAPELTGHERRGMVIAPHIGNMFVLTAQTRAEQQWIRRRGSAWPTWLAAEDCENTRDQKRARGEEYHTPDNRAAVAVLRSAVYDTSTDEE